MRWFTLHVNYQPKTGFSKFLSGGFKGLVWLFIGTLVLSILGLLFVVIADPTATGPIYMALININLIFAIVFFIFIGKQLMMLFLEKKRGMIGTRLHVRLMAIFATLAIVPALMVGAFSIFLLNQGIESWFSSRVTTALNGSLEVAQAYLKEHERSLLVEAHAVAEDTRVSLSTFFIDVEGFKKILAREQYYRQLADVAVYDTSGNRVAYAGDFEPPKLSKEILEFFRYPAAHGETFQNIQQRRVSAVVPLSSDSFLVVGKWVDPSVLSRMDDTQAAYKEYYELRSQRESVRFIFTLFLILLTIGSLAGAIWVGMTIASRIIKPVTALVHATNNVSAGDLDVRLTPLDDDEIGILTQSFNRMAGQLKENRNLLEKKNVELGDRRRMTEAVLTGVSSGVLSLKDDGTVLTANQIAQDVFDVRVNANIKSFNAGLFKMLQHFLQNPHQSFQEKLRLSSDEEDRTLLVRMLPQKTIDGKVESVVVTFDDITELLSTQKVAAWSDVARRIAHEIKNPLTPIQLSAERLQRKYKKIIPEDDQELFSELTATIVRRVEDMRVMVNEFSDFARMPAAVMSREDVVPILKEIVLLQQEARPDIQFDVQLPESGEAIIDCDRSHVSRVFTNIVENAVNAIEEDEKSGKKVSQASIKVVVEMSPDGKLVTTVTDTGKGLPEDVDTDTLFDPYVTTRKKGTGLGLAIVRRVMDEHGGQIRLMRREEGGTLVEMIFPVSKMKE